MTTRFRDRVDAGRRLAESLRAYANRADVLVLALPRGGVPVGFEVASALGVALDIFVVRKLGVPGQEELAMGAVAPGDVRVLDESIVRAAGVSQADLDRITRDERATVESRERQYRGDRPAPDVAGKTVIVVDDGLATGASMRAAIMALRTQAPARLIVAVPVAAQESCDAMREIADEVVCLETPEWFQAVGLWYEDFSQTSDEEVRALLNQSENQHVGRGPR